MNQRALVVALFGLATTMTACHKKPPVTEATPNTGTTAPTQANTATTTPTTTPTNTTTGASAREITDRVTAALGERIHFEYDQAAVRDQDRGILDAKIAILRKNPAARIRVTGNCDERGSDDYNITLGMKRAAAAKDYMVRAGIDASRIDVSSLGREKPIDPASNEAAWAANRRDEFEVTAGGQVLLQP